MKKQPFKTYLLVLLCFANSAYSQELLNLKVAIDTALYNNLGLIISRNEATITINNASPANAGMLPKLDVNVGTSYSSLNLNQKFNTGVEIDKAGVGNKTFNGQLALTWTLFDGTKMFATYHKLEVLRDMGELNVQIKTEEIILQVIKAYTDIVKQNILLRGTKKNFSLYEERVKLADMKLKIGKSSKSELLQASLDLNIQKGNLIRQTTQLNNAKLDLRRIMMQPLKSDFEVTDSLYIDRNIVLETTLNDLESGNKQLQLLRMTQQQREHEIKEQESFFYPKVNLNAGYNFNSNASTQGLFLVNQNYGPMIGLTLNWNIYNGVQRKIVENTKLQRENTRLLYDDTKITLQNMVVNSWQRYHDAIELVNTELESYQLSNENLNIMSLRFKLNEATILELKDAQQANEDCVTRLANTYYDAKAAETDLLYLVGKLIK